MARGGSGPRGRESLGSRRFATLPVSPVYREPVGACGDRPALREVTDSVMIQKFRPAVMPIRFSVGHFTLEGEVTLVLLSDWLN